MVGRGVGDRGVGVKGSRGPEQKKKLIVLQSFTAILKPSFFFSYSSINLKPFFFFFYD